MTAHVFLGPTLPAAQASEHLDATFHPPVQQGDVLAALEAGASAIGIVDGYFELVPSVWHKEILLALERGVPVYGAASMGALRAAELHGFGMVGVGRVFEWFRSGRLEDDDEVAVTHGPPEFGYPALSEAMVNIRDLLEAAVAAGAASIELHDELIGLAKGLHYSERAYARLLALARSLGRASESLAAVDAFRAGYGPSLKQRDAIAMLETMAQAPGGPGVRPDWRVERTIFFESLRREVQMRAPAAPAPVGETVDVARKKALLRLLARHEAARAGIELPFADVQAASDGFREHFGLTTADATEGWLQTAGLTAETFRELMVDAALIDRLERELADELDGALVDQARLSSVRLWARDWV
jgi:hypothetical protein